MNGTRVGRGVTGEHPSRVAGAVGRADRSAIRRHALLLVSMLAAAFGCATSPEDPADAGSTLDGGASEDAGASDGGSAIACPRVRVVTAGEVLNIRPTASTAMAVIGSLPDGAIVEVVSMVHGESIDGVDLWYEIRSSYGDGFVFSSFAECTEDEIPVPTGYFVPFACGASVPVTQSPGGGTSHTGRAMYAYDFGVPLETEIRAMRAGTVTYVFTDTGPGDPCYDGGDASCGAASNLVILEHEDGATSVYKHINSATVAVGDVVAQGDVIARSGTTGYSTGPHLHAEVRDGCPTTVYCDTVPFTFADVGSPAAGTTVVSGNCP